MNDPFLTTDLSAKKSPDFYTIQEGVNKLHILSTPVACYKAYDSVNKNYLYSFDWIEGYSKRFECYAMTEDNHIIKFAMPKTVALAVQTLAKDEDSKFTSFPMPYPIKITATGAGTKEVNYMVTPGKETIVPEEVLKELATLPRLKDVIENKIIRQDTQASAVVTKALEVDEEELDNIPF